MTMTNYLDHLIRSLSIRLFRPGQIEERPDSIDVG